jgi:ribonuclease T1
MLCRRAPGKGDQGAAMRLLAIAAWFLGVAAVGAVAAPAQPADQQALTAFAERAGLRDVVGFVETVQTLRSTRRLPPRYVTKREASAHGWHGGGLCEAWPGHVIGGDVFNNFGASLPPAPAGAYREADLDGDCRSRGARRLIFSADGRIWVTLDHYNTFIVVP